MPELLNPLAYLNAGKDGTFAASGKFKSTAANVDQFIAHLDANDIENLIIYFHGGLVGERSGIEAATLMDKTFNETTTKRHALSIVWETGPGEVLKQNLDDLLSGAKTELCDEALNFVIKIVAKKLGLVDGAKGGGAGEYLSTDMIEDEKQKEVPFENLEKAVGAKGIGELKIEDEEAALAKLEAEAKALIQSEASDALMDPKPHDLAMLDNDLAVTQEDGAKGISWIKIAWAVGAIALNVLKRFRDRTHHDFYPTVVEETFRKFYLGKLGTWGWTMIKQKAASMFNDNTGRSGDDLYVGSLLLANLERHYVARTKAGKKFQIDLVGHSAGSIVICHLLGAVMRSHQQLAFNTVFFLAPACRVDLFLAHGPAAKQQGVFKKFKMFTMREEAEKADHCIRYVYTRSLLYLVSGLFEIDARNNGEIDAKILGLQEHFKAEGRYANVDDLTNVRDFLKTVHVALSKDADHQDESLRTTAIKHGDFDNDPLTLQAIKHSLAL